MYKKLIIILFISILLFGCKKNSTSSSNIGIEWDQYISWSYMYAYGTIIGQTFHIEFTIIEGSGDLEMEVTIKIDDSKKKSITVEVTEGGDYQIDIPFTYSGSISCNRGDIYGYLKINAGYTKSFRRDFECSTSRPENFSVGDPSVKEL